MEIAARQEIVSHPLLDRWLHHLRQGQFDALAAMYHPCAVMQWQFGTTRGRADIDETLQAHRRRLRHVRVLAAKSLHEAPSAISFETRLMGWFGTIHLRHHLVLRREAITQHRIEVLERHRDQVEVPFEVLDGIQSPDCIASPSSPASSPAMPA